MIFFPLSINKSAKLSLLSNQTPTNWPYVSNIQKVCQLGSNYQSFSSDNRSQILKIISNLENDPTITKCQEVTKKMAINIYTVNLPRMLLGILQVISHLVNVVLKVTRSNIVFYLCSHMMVLGLNDNLTSLYNGIPWLSGIHRHSQLTRQASGPELTNHPVRTHSGIGWVFADPRESFILQRKSWILHFAYRVPKKILSHMHLFEALGSGGEDPYCTYESVLYAFFISSFLTGPGPRIPSRFRVSFSFGKNSLDGLKKIFNNSGSFSWVYLWTFELFKPYGMQFKRWDANLDPWIKIGTSAFTNKTQHQTTVPALKPDLHFEPSRFASWISCF